ncbi:MAG: hypothetical protein KatS3mg105_2602 [Gemmatales bacterium]|nr:MAG: hypothetical protein KatS3mg105_2602 [Gemmatales bacterium]
MLIGTTTTLAPQGGIAIEILADNRIGEIIFKKGQVGGGAGFKVHAQGGGDFTQVAAGGAVANRALIIDAGQATFKGNVSISYNSISGRPAPRQFRVDYENNSPVLQLTDNINANGRVWVAKRVKVVDGEDVVNIKRLVFAETGGGTFGVFSKMPEFTVKNTDRMVKPKTWSIE